MPILPENRERYPADWKLRSHFVRFVRAKGFCEWCAAEHGKPHPITGSKVVLTTAHIYNDEPEACDLLNLRALCQKCHNQHYAERRAQGRKARQEKMSGQTHLEL